MHFRPTVMTLDFVRKVERKTAEVPKMTVMYWKSGPELYIFVCARLKAPDTKQGPQQPVPLCGPETSHTRKHIAGGARCALVARAKPFHSAYSNYV